MGRFLKLVVAFAEEALDGAASLLLFWRQAPVDVHHFHCTKCGQRFRYREGSVPGRAWCPRCLVPLRLPQAARR
jgi:hypothetical protein